MVTSTITSVQHKMQLLPNRLAIFSLLALTVRCFEFAADTKVSGICSRPNLPPKARILQTPTEKVKFNENEKIAIECEKNQFPPFDQRRTCKGGSWEGEEARCGKAVNANVVNIKAFRCEDTHSSILAYNLNQTDTSQVHTQLFTNSFHFLRINQSMTVFGSKCYRWIFTFERKIEISFLLLDISFPKVNSLNETPIVNVDVTHRICKLRYRNHQIVDMIDEVFGNYFFCDLKANLVNDTERYNTDYLIMDVHLPTKRTINLEAVFVGETYKKPLKKVNVPDCGKLGIRRTGVLEQTELSHSLISCNTSFVEQGGPKVHKYVCDANGLWQGTWPVCVPKKTCPKGEILEELDSSVVIEQIGNVYYSNATHWDAIDYTWVRYACANLDSGIMVGRNDRLCMHGSWSNKMPSCTLAPGLQSSSLTVILVIAGILIALIAVFSLIVYLSVKKMSRKLKSTKNELQASALNQQIYSHEYYAQAELHEMDAIYEDINKDLYSVPLYETSEAHRYDSPPRAVNEPEYLSMSEAKSRTMNRDPEYANY